MADDTMRSEQADKILNAIKVLEELERNGTIKPEEQKALDRARSQQKSAEQTFAETEALYTGVTSGGLLGFDDEIIGAYNAATQNLVHGDLEGAKAAYKKYRDLRRQKEDMLRLAAPGEYESGQTAGGIMQMPVGGAEAMALKAAPWMGKVVAGALTGAAFPALMDIGSSRKEGISSLTDIGPISTAAGAAIGGSAPIIGNVSGQVTRGAQELLRGGGQFGFKGSALRRVAPKVASVQETGEDVAAYLADLGPEGMISDIPGRPQKMAQGLTTISGTGGNVVQQELTKRVKGSEGRITSDVNKYIEQPNVGYEATKASKERMYSELGPMYDAAKASGVQFDVTDLRKMIDDVYPDASSSVRAQLDTLKADIAKEGDISAARLHNARSALSDAMQTGGGDVSKNMKPFLNQMDEMLDTIEGYSTARAGWADESKIQRAIDFGRRQVIGGSAKSAISPAELSDMLKKMSEAEREAVKKGARDYIGALMGTSGNAASAAWREFKKGWSGEKLKMLIGEDAARDVTRRMLAEEQFAETNTIVQGGAQSAQRREEAQALGDLVSPDTGQQMTFGKRARTALIDAPLNRITNEILYGGRTELNKQIGQILTLQGKERDQVVQFLLNEAQRLDDPTKMQQIVDAFAQAGLFTTAGQLSEGQ